MKVIIGVFFLLFLIISINGTQLEKQCCDYVCKSKCVLSLGLLCTDGLLTLRGTLINLCSSAGYPC
ncbi:hypothetical protein Mgra_00009591 [Meloidogyne graminicola]|uniref:Uncharacterized protein n=1 Tax=Meloidogyne graminicola TaxID=189291 RepID=A0A8S9ZDA4_9BILA|nr:hypothetical protein Mgra_00009591 [Meloidogyne graminicola]